MNIHIKNALGLAAAAALGLGAAGCGPLANLIATPTPYPPGRMVWAIQISSKALAGNRVGDPADRRFSVYLPPTYDQGDHRYPVLYLLDGFGGGVDAGELVRTMGFALDERQSKEMILVFLDATSKLGGSFYLSSPTMGDWDTYITQEVVSQVDRSFRTIADREARAVSGCSMGGYGALHLAFSHPDVFSVAEASSGVALWSDSLWEQARSQYGQQMGGTGIIYSFAAPEPLSWYVAVAAAAAPDPSKPPTYFDMPFEMIDGQPRIVPEVRAEMDAVGPKADLTRYLAQSVRLKGLMIYHGAYDKPEAWRAFDKLLSQSGVTHTYLEVPSGHCDLDWTPVLKFVSDHLTH